MEEDSCGADLRWSASDYCSLTDIPFSGLSFLWSGAIDFSVIDEGGRRSADKLILKLTPSFRKIHHKICICTSHNH